MFIFLLALGEDYNILVMTRIRRSRRVHRIRRRPRTCSARTARAPFLMRRLMDRVERFTDGGNVVRLILNRS